MDPITGGVLACLAYDGLRKGAAKVSPDQFSQEIQQAAERAVSEDDELRVDHFLTLLESDAVADEVTALKEEGEQPSLEVFEAELGAIATTDAMKDARETLELFFEELEKQTRSRPEIWRSITLSYIQDQTEDIRGLQQTIKKFESELGELADVISPSPIEAAREQLADQGFTWITEKVIERQSLDPDYCWQRAFNMAELREEIPVKRRYSVADKPTLSEKLLDDLEDGGAQVVVGPPGSGKTTSTKITALEWHDDIDRGPVLHRRGGEANRFDDPTALSQAIDVARDGGPVLVVVDDFVRPDNAGIYAILTKYRNIDDVSFLLNSRTQEWRNRYSRLKNTSRVDYGSDFGDEVREVLESYVQPPIEVPPVDEKEIDKLIDRFESVTDQSVHFTAETIYDEIKGRRGVSPMLLLSYYLLVEADIEHLTGETPLERNVSQVFAKVNPEMGAFDVSTSRNMDLLRKMSLLINILNLTDIGVHPAFLHGLAESEEEHSQITGFIDDLEGMMLFGQRDDARYRTNHELWSTLYMEQFAAKTTSPDDKEIFQACVNSIFSLLDDEGKRKLVRQRADSSTDILDTIADRETSFVSDIVLEIFRIGTTRPKLASLFGNSEDSNIDLPESIPERKWVSVPRRRAMMFRDNGNFERAKSELDEMKRRLEEASDDVERMLSFYHTHWGSLHTRRNEYEEAIECYRDALDIAQRVEDRHQIGNNLHNIGSMEIKLGRYSEARRHLERALEIKDELNDDGDKAAVLNKLGELALKIGEYDAAEEKCTRSLRMSQSQHDRNGEAYAYFWLAMTALRREAYEKAESLFLKSYNIFEERGYVDRQIAILQSLGSVAWKQQKYDIARERLESARNLSKEFGFKIEATKALKTLGKVELEEGNIEPALQHAQECYQRYRNQEMTREVLGTIDLISQIHLSNDDDAAAEEWAAHGLELIDEFESDELLSIRQTLEKRLAQTAEEPKNAPILYRFGVEAIRKQEAETAIEHFQLAWEQHTRDKQSDEQRRASLAAGLQLLLNYEAVPSDAADLNLEDIESYLKCHRDELNDAGKECLAYLTGEADKLDLDPIEVDGSVMEMTIKELQHEAILRLRETVEFGQAPISEQYQQALECIVGGDIELATDIFETIVSQGQAEDEQEVSTRKEYHSSQLVLELFRGDVVVGEDDSVAKEKLTEPAKLVFEQLADEKEDGEPKLSPGELLAQHNDRWEEGPPERWQAWMTLYGRKIGDPYLDIHDVLEIYEFGLRDIRNNHLSKSRKHLREAWSRRDTLDKESNRFCGAVAAGVTYAALLTVHGQEGLTWNFDYTLETEEKIQAIVSEAAEYDIDLTDPVETMIGALSDADLDTSPIDIVAGAGFEGTDINNLEAIVYRQLLDNVQEHRKLQSRSPTKLHDQAVESIRSSDSMRAKRELKAAWIARHDYEPGTNDHIEALKAGVGYAAHLEIIDATSESVTPQEILNTVKQSEESLPDHVRALQRYLETGITLPSQLETFDNPESPEAESYAILYQVLSSDT